MSEPFAIGARDDATVWPRCDYPSAEDALVAHADFSAWGYGPSDGDGLWWAEMDGYRVRLVWVWRVHNHPEGEWFVWESGRRRPIHVYADSDFTTTADPAVECWEVSV